jgi:hypothetical protein
MSAPKIGDRVTVRIGQIDSPNVAYVPGIVTDAHIQNRDLPTRKGTILVQNSIMVTTLRANQQPGNGRAQFFFVNRPENLIALSLRDTLVPAIDGADRVTYTALKPRLEAAVAASTAALNPAPEKKAVEDAFAVFASAPALVLATA